MQQTIHTLQEGPLEQLEAEHARQLQTLTSLETITKREDSVEMIRFASELLNFFTVDLTRHMEHEENGLFPILKQRCHPSDNLEMIINQLSHEHELDRDLVDFLVSDLKKIAHGLHGAIPMRFNINAQAFIETQRRHIDWENKIVLPLARKRLTAEDLRDLKNSMNE